MRPLRLSATVPRDELRTLPLLPSAARPRVRGPRPDAAGKLVPLRAGAGRYGAVLPAAGHGLRRMLPRPARRVRAPGRDLLGVRLLLLVFRQLARALPPLRGDGDRALRAG